MLANTKIYYYESVRNVKCNPFVSEKALRNATATMFLVHWSKYVGQVNQEKWKKIHVWNCWTRKSILSPSSVEHHVFTFGTFFGNNVVPCSMFNFERMNEMWPLYNSWVCSLVYCEKIKWVCLIFVSKKNTNSCHLFVSATVYTVCILL